MKPDIFSLRGKTALVTGGSRGLGAEMARGFASCGADLVITSRKIAACEALAEELERAYGCNAFPYACHIGHWDEIEGLVDAAYQRFGKIDVLVNNAGLSPLYESLSEVTEKQWDTVLGVNLKGPFRLSVVVGTRMAHSGGGSIINVSSVGGLRPEAHAVPYGAAKAGLNNLTVGLARAFGPNVRVNCIVAGAFFTDIAKSWDLEAFQIRAKSNFAMQRGGEPEEVVGTAVYLASDASSYTTGALISVDGGYA